MDYKNANNILPDRLEGMLERIADKSVREKVCELIDMAKESDGEALEMMESLIAVSISK